MAYIQAFISNNSFPTSIDELLERSSRFDMEALLGVMMPEELEQNLYNHVVWTAPAWCKNGDIVFFMHSMSAFLSIRSLRSELQKKKSDLDEEKYWYLMNSLWRAETIWQTYGGMIFAVGRVAGGPEYYDDNCILKHWRSNLYAPINSVFVLEHPIDLHEFNQTIKLSSTGSVTPVFGNDFEYLKKLIIRKNKYVRDYLVEALPQPIPLTKMTSVNWIDVAGQYRSDFSDGFQFRKYYVDYLLKALGDLQGIHTYCKYYKDNVYCGRIDNIIRFNKKFLKVKVVLSLSKSIGLIQELHKYTLADKICGNNRRSFIDSDFWKNLVLVIDTDDIYLYYYPQDTLYKLYELNNIKLLSDINFVRDVLAEAIATINSTGLHDVEKITPDQLANVDLDEMDLDDFDVDEALEDITLDDMDDDIGFDDDNEDL